ncbi:hypothetical protein FKP32DRAFT_1593176 [Trametes sanguinea]|nr:hypothetical protein FKP32DRAFT_1593176 [Trametes sanguinea]
MSHLTPLIPATHSLSYLSLSFQAFLRICSNLACPSSLFIPAIFSPSPSSHRPRVMDSALGHPGFVHALYHEKLSSSLSEIGHSEMADVSLRQEQFAPQMLTPPASEKSVTFESQDLVGDYPPENTVLSVSTTFHPAAGLLPIPADLIFLSSDGVFFYVHLTQILSKSTNRFKDLVPPQACADTGKDVMSGDLGPVITLPEAATVLNVILHSVYELSCAHYRPDLDTLVAAVDAMAVYGLPPKRHVASSTPLYSLILAQAPLRPMAVYALAASHDIYDLAVAVSSYLISFPFDAVTDDMASRMGPVYLKRLFFLHVGRLEALKRLIETPPHFHPATEKCDFEEQKKLARSWTLAAAYLVWEAKPGLTASAMESALLPLSDSLSCALCKKGLAERVKQLVVQWSAVKRTI